jgi:hypothetical protein
MLSFGIYIMTCIFLPLLNAYIVFSRRFRSTFESFESLCRACYIYFNLSMLINILAFSEVSLLKWLSRTRGGGTNWFSAHLHATEKCCFTVCDNLSFGSSENLTVGVFPSAVQHREINIYCAGVLVVWLWHGRLVLKKVRWISSI